MRARPALRRAEREVMLDAVSLKSSRAAVVHMHGQGHCDGSLWKHEPLAIVLVDAQVIGDDLKLIAGHLEYLVVVNSHGRERNLEHSLGKCSCYLRWTNRAVKSKSAAQDRQLHPESLTFLSKINPNEN